MRKDESIPQISNCSKRVSLPPGSYLNCKDPLPAKTISWQVAHNLQTAHNWQIAHWHIRAHISERPQRPLACWTRSSGVIRGRPVRIAEVWDWVPGVKGGVENEGGSSVMVCVVNSIVHLQKRRMRHFMQRQLSDMKAVIGSLMKAVCSHYTPLDKRRPKEGLQGRVAEKLHRDWSKTLAQNLPSSLVCILCQGY